MKRIIFPLLVLLSTACSHQGPYDIRDYGAKGDSTTMNTVAIQKAIDAAAAAGGGQVLIPEGKFLTGALQLKSDVELNMSDKAVLLGSDKRADYATTYPLALITAKNQQRVAITGKGVIDGQGREFIKDIFRQLKAGTITDPQWKIKRPVEKNRHHLIYMDSCDGVIVKNVTLKDASSWVQDYVNCRNLEFDSIRVESVAYWNNDGIDLVDCEKARITNCYINASDDAICLKSEDSTRGCRDIYIDNCTVRSSASGFKIGTATHGGFKNITVKNLTVFDTYRSAIAIEAVDGGIIEDIEVKNVVGKNTGNAIFIKLGHRNAGPRISTLRNIHIANVRVEVPAGKPDAGYEIEGPLLKYPPGFKPVPGKIVSVSPHNHSGIDQNVIIYPHNVFPSSITGLPGHPVQNVTLENIEIVYAGGADRSKAYYPLDSLGSITEASWNYPEFSMFGELPAWGFYVRHAAGIKWKNITLRYLKEDFRTPLIFDDVKGLSIDGLDIPAAASAPAIVLKDTEGAQLNNITTPFGPVKGIRQL